jgi:hypothetical protein
MLFLMLFQKPTLMSNQQEPQYAIPVKYRKMENLHIVFWLFKDISWCLNWKILGVLMILPTLAIAIVITIRNRYWVSETCHNAAIVFWITANSYWMISEFLHFDTIILHGNYTYKHLTAIPFIIGIVILAYYYLVWKMKHRDVIETM